MWKAIKAVFRFLLVVAKYLFCCYAVLLAIFAAVAFVDNSRNQNAAIALLVLGGCGVFAIYLLLHAADRIPQWAASSAGVPNNGASYPQGRYVGWPLPTLIVTLILGLIPPVAALGSEPSLAVFAATTITNPVLWFALYPYWFLGRMRCPHCRKSASMSNVSDAAVGSPLVCPRCNNLVSKPAG
jgi:hypothetical protein